VPPSVNIPASAPFIHSESTTVHYCQAPTFRPHTSLHASYNVEINSELNPKTLILGLLFAIIIYNKGYFLFT
jgi:hypothetical protein